MLRTVCVELLGRAQQGELAQVFPRLDVEGTALVPLHDALPRTAATFAHGMRERRPAARNGRVCVRKIIHARTHAGHPTCIAPY